MTRLRMIAFLGITAMGLAACVTDPRLGANVSLGQGGLSVSPQISGRVGGLTVGISP